MELFDLNFQGLDFRVLLMDAVGKLGFHVAIKAGQIEGQFVAGDGFFTTEGPIGVAASDSHFDHTVDCGFGPVIGGDVGELGFNGG